MPVTCTTKVWNPPSYLAFLLLGNVRNFSLLLNVTPLTDCSSCLAGNYLFKALTSYKESRMLNFLRYPKRNSGLAYAGGDLTLQAKLRQERDCFLLPWRPTLVFLVGLLGLCYKNVWPRAETGDLILQFALKERMSRFKIPFSLKLR
jgi:hypothetical protein